MALAPPPPQRSLPAPVSSAAPPSGLVVARWTYVDEARTHEVHAGIRPGERPAFVVKESSFQNDDPDAIIETSYPIESPWEPQLYHWQLECRLALLGGKYWRHDANEPGWRPLHAPQGLPEIDTREVMVSPYLGRVAFHHFFHRRTREDRLLVVVPQPESGGRYLVASVALEFPKGADAAILLLHRSLPEAPARSLLMREHLALRNEGYEKLVWGPEIAQAHGLQWPRELASAYHDILQRISQGRFGSPKDAREAVIDPLYTDFLGALTDPRLLELQARYITPEEQAEALAGGAPAIRRLIAAKRERAPHDEQHKLTVLEASLLAREQLKPGRRVDPEVSALVRRFSYYL